MKLILVTTLFLSSLFNNLLAVETKGIAILQKNHGTVFKSSEGKTVIVKSGDTLQTEDEVFTEISASANVLIDNRFMYYLTGGSRIKIKKNEVNLMSGQLYVQSSVAAPIFLFTANGLVEFSKGEMVLTYESDKSKTQVLVISGTAKFGNKLERDYNVTIGNGQFSFIDNSEEYLYPRNPTNIGNSSFVKMKTAFHNINNIESLDHYRMEELTASTNVDTFNAQIERVLGANSTKEVTPEVHHGGSRGIASEKPVKKVVHPSKKVTKQKVVARVFGMSDEVVAPPVVKSAVRSPAEVKKESVAESEDDQSNLHSSAYKQEADRLMEELSNYRSEVKK